jgi:hypothetical protein
MESAARRPRIAHGEKGVQPSALRTGNAALLEYVRGEIRACGPVPFAWVMEQALYHPSTAIIAVDVRLSGGVETTSPASVWGRCSAG